MLALEPAFEHFEAEGTVFGSIGKGDFHAIPCLRPPRDLVRAFEDVLRPVEDRIELNERESGSLASLRDTLLRKLISGERRVPQAERMVEAVPI